MKKLFICRHAKSSWDFPELGDRQRPLIKTGIARTKRVIGYLNKKNQSAGLIISSPAVRALDTAKLVAEGIGYPADMIRIEKVIYEGDYENILDLVYGVPDEIESVMIFGHNPHLTMLTNFFTRPEIDNLPTSGIACFSFKTDRWNDIPSCSRETEFIIYPRMLK